MIPELNLKDERELAIQIGSGQRKASQEMKECVQGSEVRMGAEAGG